MCINDCLCLRFDAAYGNIRNKSESCRISCRLMRQTFTSAGTETGHRHRGGTFTLLYFKFFLILKICLKRKKRVIHSPKRCLIVQVCKIAKRWSPYFLIGPENSSCAQAHGDKKSMCGMIDFLTWRKSPLTGQSFVIGNN